MGAKSGRGSTTRLVQIKKGAVRRVALVKNRIFVCSTVAALCTNSRNWPSVEARN